LFIGIPFGLADISAAVSFQFSGRITARSKTSVYVAVFLYFIWALVKKVKEI